MSKRKQAINLLVQKWRLVSFFKTLLLQRRKILFCHFLVKHCKPNQIVNINLRSNFSCIKMRKICKSNQRLLLSQIPNIFDQPDLNMSVMWLVSRISIGSVKKVCVYVILLVISLHKMYHWSFFIKGFLRSWLPL